MYVTSDKKKSNSRFEAKLAPVFSHLHDIYASFDGRIKADNFRRQIMSVTSVWETRMIFNNDNVESWVKTFLGQVEQEQRTSEEPVEEAVEKPVEKKGRWKSVAETSGKEATEKGGFTSIPITSPEVDDEDLDGKEMEEDIDGMPMEEEEDVDGEPMEDEDVDGEPMEEEDLDGMPMEEPRRVEAEPEPQKSPERQVEKHDAPRPQKRQRMRAADMFAED